MADNVIALGIMFAVIGALAGFGAAYAVSGLLWIEVKRLRCALRDYRALRDAVCRMHCVDGALGEGYYNDDDWLRAYRATRALSGCTGGKA